MTPTFPPTLIAKPKDDTSPPHPTPPEYMAAFVHRNKRLKQILTCTYNEPEADTSDCDNEEKESVCNRVCAGDRHISWEEIQKAYPKTHTRYKQWYEKYTHTNLPPVDAGVGEEEEMGGKETLGSVVNLSGGKKAKKRFPVGGDGSVEDYSNWDELRAKNWGVKEHPRGGYWLK
eukprot:GDKI01031414.1.p1 GENE.GDKI01031414.1~~GDKI01031414.1.p1  ORF type:complete len:174 (-),score=52.89 GDKI01031414.1:199-720(-)